MIVGILLQGIFTWKEIEVLYGQGGHVFISLNCQCRFLAVKTPALPKLKEEKC